MLGFLLLQIVNFGGDKVNLKIDVGVLDPNSIQLSGSTKTVPTSGNLKDENSFNQPKKVLEELPFP